MSKSYRWRRDLEQTTIADILLRKTSMMCVLLWYIDYLTTSGWYFYIFLLCCHLLEIVWSEEQFLPFTPEASDHREIWLASHEWPSDQWMSSTDLYTSVQSVNGVNDSREYEFNYALFCDTWLFRHTRSHIIYFISVYFIDNIIIISGYVLCIVFWFKILYGTYDAI